MGRPAPIQIDYGEMISNCSHTIFLCGLYENNPTRDIMRKIFLSLITVSAITLAASLAPANAMTVGTASGIKQHLPTPVCWKRPPMFAAIAIIAAVASAVAAESLSLAVAPVSLVGKHKIL
jgi:hypothetical protein